MRTQHENIIIESSIPIAHILKLKMDNRLNEHGALNMKAVIHPDMQNAFLKANYLGQNVQFFALLEDEPTLIFSGKILNVTYERQDDVLTASIGVMSYSVELDERLMRRSFQNTSVRFRTLLDLITSDTNARFNWQVGSDKAVGKPFIQYDETDWTFAKRLASYFNRPVHVSVLSERADVYFGVRTGAGQTINEASILELGISRDYYKKGGYENNGLRNQYYYLKVKNCEHWQLGDFAQHRNSRLTVINTEVTFEKGELTFIHTLGAEGYIRQGIIYADHLMGLNLQGTIRKTEKESITIQLDIDHDKQAHYLWPWMPEVGNLNYLMPEVNSKVALTFPTNDEKDAFASHLLRTNSNSGIYEQVQNKQMVTVEDKTIGLHANHLLLAGKNQEVKVTLSDQEGIRLDSHSNIRMRAGRKIQLRGKKVIIDAPTQVLIQTSQSNIDVAGNFNFFAPKGVSTSSEVPYQPPAKTQPVGSSNQNHLPLCYGAMGAMPRSVGVNGENQDPMVNAASGVMPRMAGGQTAIAMDQMMKGANVDATSHPTAISSMGSFSMKGGTAVPRDEMGDG